MAVTTSGKAYDNPSIIGRRFHHGTVASGTLTPRHYLVAATPLEIYQLYGIITTAGSTTTSAFDVVTVGSNGTTTTTVASTIVSSNTAGQNFSVDCTTSAAGPTTMVAGSYAYAQTRLDATLTAMAVWEYALQPTSGICNPA